MNMVEHRAMTWRDSKDAGKEAFALGEFSEALTFYIDAIDLLTSEEREGSNSDISASRGSNDHANEHQILLSNVIACRLKIGGQEMAEKAVEEAKKCIEINNQWSKAHVRLASAYIALGGHSNDACVALQRALSLDRNNKIAREMLVNEMRQRNNRERTGDSSSSDQEGSQEVRTGSSPSSSQSNHAERSHTTEATPHGSFPAPSAPPPGPSQSTNTGSNTDGIDVDDIDPPDAYYSLSLSERIQHHFSQAITWYHSQSDDIQTFLKVACFFLILYVALGGRFGLDYVLGGNKNLSRRGNYGQGNAYDRYSPSSSSSYSSSYDRYSDPYGSERQHHRQQKARDSHHAYDQQRQTGSSGYNDRSNSQNDRYYSRYGNDHDHYYEPRGRRTSTSYQIPSMAIMLIVGLICHRFGLNPFQVMMFVNLMQGRGGNRGMGRFGYGGFRGGLGGGFGGMGGGFGGFGRRRYGMGRRGRGGFY